MLSGGETYREGGYYQPSTTSGATVARALIWRHTEFGTLSGQWDFRHARKSVRLASVVSEGLTQTRKCYIVFGTGCSRLSF